MAHLTKLTISNAARQVSTSPSESRRAKLLEKLAEQLKMATAFVSDQPYSATRKVWAVDENGTKQRVERPKRLQYWFWSDTAGKFLFELRYGARKLELAKGKHAIEIGGKHQLISVIETVIEAVKGGELDAALNSVSASEAAKAKQKS